MQYKALFQLFSAMDQANEEIIDLFRRVDQEVADLDEDNLLLPGDYREEEFYIIWPLASTYQEEDEDEDIKIKDLEFEDEDEPEEEDDKKDEDIEQKEISYEIGLYVWSPKPGEAAVSVYVVLDGGSKVERWQRVKEIARDTGGRILLEFDDWSEDEVEIKRFNLADDIDHTEIARVIVEVAKEL